MKSAYENYYSSYGTTASLEDAEKGPLLNELGLPSPAQNNKADVRVKASLYSIILLVATIILVAIGVAQTSGTSINTLGGRSQLKVDATAAISERIVIYSKGDYESTDNLNLLPWDTIAEPYRYHVLSIDEEVAKKHALSWTINGKNFTGNGVTVRFDSPGVVYDCSLTLVNTDSEETSLRPFTLAVKYVRREIKSLTTEDREAYLDAMKIIYDLKNASANKAKYGGNFKSIDYFALKHLGGAATSDCDHYHDGQGFGNTHISLSLEFEGSIQAIYPHLAMPYWEYGIDALVFGTEWSESPIFDWYGEVPPRATKPNSYAHGIADESQWAGIEVPMASEDVFNNWDVEKEGILNPYSNAYGQLRSPWNENPSKLMGRSMDTYGYTGFTLFPTCDVFSYYYKTDSLGVMMSALNGITHGPVHIMVGGAWDDSVVFNETEDISVLQSLDRILYFKIMWRRGLTRCPSSCTVGEPCKCAIPEQYWTTLGVDKMVEMAQMNDDIGHLSKYLARADQAQKRAFLEMCASPGIVGDALTSNAAFDPIFWPLHGQIERLLGLKRLNKALGLSAFDERWANSYYDDATALKGVCDWSNVKSAEDLTLPHCNSTLTCYGHGENDIVDFVYEDPTSEDILHSFTNSEFYNWVHPMNEVLPYVYDTYQFSYCDDSNGGFVGPEFLPDVKQSVRVKYMPARKNYINSYEDVRKHSGRRAQKAVLEALR
jgi:hypothetical protein